MVGWTCQRQNGAGPAGARTRGAWSTVKIAFPGDVHRSIELRATACWSRRSSTCAGRSRPSPRRDWSSRARRGRAGGLRVPGSLRGRRSHRTCGCPNCSRRPRTHSHDLQLHVPARPRRWPLWPHDAGESALAARSPKVRCPRAWRCWISSTRRRGAPESAPEPRRRREGAATPRAGLFARERAGGGYPFCRPHNTYNADYFAETPARRSGRCCPYFTAMASEIRHFWSRSSFYAPSEPGQVYPPRRHARTVLEPARPHARGRPADFDEGSSITTDGPGSDPGVIDRFTVAVAVGARRRAARGPLARTRARRAARPAARRARRSATRSSSRFTDPSREHDVDLLGVGGGRRCAERGSLARRAGGST